MIEELISETEGRLEYYEAAVDSLNEKFDATTAPSHNPNAGKVIRMPVVHQRIVSFLLDKLRAHDVAMAELKQEYDRVTERFSAFKAEKGTAYTDALYDELTRLVDGYPGTICYFLKLDPIDIELGNDLDGRDAIEFLLEELADSHDLSNLRLRTSTLDEVLKCKYKLHADIIFEYEHWVTKSHYPAKYWWRHPSEFLD